MNERGIRSDPPLGGEMVGGPGDILPPNHVHLYSPLFVGERNDRTLKNKNRLSSTTCGEELQKIFKDWQIFKGFCQKAPKKSLILSDLRF